MLLFLCIAAWSLGCSESSNPLRPAGPDDLVGAWEFVSATSPGFPGITIRARETVTTPGSIPEVSSGLSTSVNATLVFTSSTFSIEGTVSGLTATSTTGQYVLNDSSMIIQVIDNKKGTLGTEKIKAWILENGQLEISGFGPFRGVSTLTYSFVGYIELMTVFRRIS